jgi:NAD(P)-dependent dehydrogenase (short-subunit alcohol dehydrogenase family)
MSAAEAACYNAVGTIREGAVAEAGVLAGKAALVTGGSGAIGAASAKRLLQDGASVLLMGRRLGALEAAQAALREAVPGGQVEIFAGDAVQRADVEAALALAHAMLGRLDVLVSTVGGGDFRSVLKTDPESFRATLDLNITSVFLLVRYGVPMMREGGAIVCISSGVAKKFHELLTPYCAAKGALEIFIQSVSLELARHRVRINGVRPGFTRSGGTEALFAMPEALAKTLELIPLGRAGEPEDIASAVRYLAGPEASWVTGQSIAVDGGGEINIVGAPRRQK